MNYHGSLISGCEEVDGNTNLNGVSCEANGVQEFSPGQGQILPILEKVVDLSTKVQVNLAEYLENDCIENGLSRLQSHV